jgi:hypothetical protein
MRRFGLRYLRALLSLTLQPERGLVWSWSILPSSKAFP